MQALRDEEIQKKGIVHIFYGIGKTEFHSDRAKKFADMWWLLPIRLVAFHFCYDLSVMDFAAEKIEEAMESHHLCRFRRHKGRSFMYIADLLCFLFKVRHLPPLFHFPSFLLGLDLEVIFDLMTFGIPKEVLPINPETGEIDLQYHHKWLDVMRKKEQQRKEEREAEAAAAASGGSGGGEEYGATQKPKGKEVAVPGPMDIVVGLGRQSITSCGYLKFRDTLLEHREEYENAERFAKTVIAGDILKKLLNSGCRFVRCTPDGILTECTEVEARDKISHAFRNMRQQGTRRKGRTTGSMKRGRNIEDSGGGAQDERKSSLSS